MSTAQLTSAATTEYGIKEQTEATAITNGAASAALLAAALGCTFFGLIVVLSEANHAVQQMMILNRSVGPLSGKSTFGMLAWLVSWLVLHSLLRKRHLNFQTVTAIAAVFVLIGLLSTFPPVFLAFATE
jgi:hypothetical protein